MATAEDYAMLVEQAGQEPLVGIPGPVESATTMFGEQNSDIIKDNIGIETLATAFDALDGMKSDPGAPGVS